MGKILVDDSIKRIVVEHKDRLTRVGFNYIETMLNAQDREVIVINLAATDNEDLLEDLASIIYWFCARLYGKRRAQRKADLVKMIVKCNEEEIAGTKQNPNHPIIVRQVEQHIVKQGNPMDTRLDEVSFATKNLYNLVN